MSETVLFQPELDSNVAVVGAGIAGIAVVGALLDHEVDPEKIVWVDPEFAVGDIGTLWCNVPGNTKISTLQKYLEGCESFEYDPSDMQYELNRQAAQDDSQTCELGVFADVLDDITEKLKAKIHTVQTFVTAITTDASYVTLDYQLDDEARQTSVSQLLLASGTEPKKLPETLGHAQVINLADALDPNKVRNFVTDGDVIALFGSSHSAMLAMKNLVEQCADTNITIINFYRSPIRFSYECDGKVYYDNTGLKGEVAKWTEAHFGDGGTAPTNVIRVPSNGESLAAYGRLCSKSIHAVGLERRQIPINGTTNYSYDSCTGEIVPGQIWGVGAAFPECGVDPSGEMEYRVGAGKFIDYIQRIIVPSVVTTKSLV